MSKLHWSSPSAAMEHVIEQLQARPGGLTENMLNTKHDPNLISRAIETLVSRGSIDLFIDDNEVGPKRKVYKIKG